jgi:hypothetical protein
LIAGVGSRLPRSTRRSARPALIAILRPRSPWAPFRLFTIVGPRLARRALILLLGARITRRGTGIRRRIGIVASRAFLEACALDVARNLEAIARILVLSAGPPVAATSIVTRRRRSGGIAEAPAARLERLVL